jgi:prophage maintenance system killer protein
MDILFLSLDEILEIHQNQIELYGGEPAIRDIALLESAIAMPDSANITCTKISLRWPLHTSST